MEGLEAFILHMLILLGMTREYDLVVENGVYSIRANQDLEGFENQVYIYVEFYRDQGTWSCRTGDEPIRTLRLAMLINHVFTYIHGKEVT